MSVEIQWSMGGAGLVAMVAVEVVVFSTVVRFQISLPSVGDKQLKQVFLQQRFCKVQRVGLESTGREQDRQDCLAQGVCLVQVRRFSCIRLCSILGLSGISEQSSVTSESEEDRVVDIVASRCLTILSLKC